MELNIDLNNVIEVKQIKEKIKPYPRLTSWFEQLLKVANGKSFVIMDCEADTETSTDEDDDDENWNKET
tara:strand:+ start:255 stop:461 length:207 start_codon:yes stop_codon:yes gene_type:complete